MGNKERRTNEGSCSNLRIRSLDEEDKRRQDLTAGHERGNAERDNKAFADYAGCSRRISD